MDLAWGDLRIAKFSLDEQDDIAIRYAAYHISQSVEKVVKAVLKEMGVSYTKTHRINDLLAKLPDSQTYLNDAWLDWLEMNDPTLNEWESKTRYVEDFVVTHRHAVRLYNDAVELYSTVKQELETYDVQQGKPIFPSSLQKSDSDSTHSFGSKLKGLSFTATEDDT